MSERIGTLAGYLMYRLAYSLVGVAYVAITLAYYGFAFRTRTPEPDYFILVIGLFGAAMSFLATLGVAARAHEAHSYPMLVRLNSRVEYVTAVLGSGLVVAMLLQVGMAVAAWLFNSPQLSWESVATIPPIWISVNILAAILALHTSDFLVKGWSRVALFGTLALLLMLNNNTQAVLGWFAGWINGMSGWWYEQRMNTGGEMFQQAANWLNGGAAIGLQNGIDTLFWPFTAVFKAVTRGYFTQAEAFAPATCLLYAAVLFLLAADLYATKEIELLED